MVWTQAIILKGKAALRLELGTTFKTLGKLHFFTMIIKGQGFPLPYSDYFERFRFKLNSYDAFNLSITFLILEVHVFT